MNFQRFTITETAIRPHRPARQLEHWCPLCDLAAHSRLHLAGCQRRSKTIPRLIPFISNDQISPLGEIVKGSL